MLRWLPPLSPADVATLLVTLAIIFTASWVGPVGAWLESRLRR